MKRLTASMTNEVLFNELSFRVQHVDNHPFYNMKEFRRDGDVDDNTATTSYHVWRADELETVNAMMKPLDISKKKNEKKEQATRAIAGKLVVQLYEAEGVKVADKNGTSDPYCT